MKLQEIVGKNIRGQRKIKKWSIEKLSEKANISPAYLGELERGRENVSVKTIESIAKALGVKPGLLLEPEAWRQIS
ncbi:MAG: helix-turn-helix domain-containing protein [Candidatus Kapaibacterium sp.]